MCSRAPRTEITLPDRFFEPLRFCELPDFSSRAAPDALLDRAPAFFFEALSLLSCFFSVTPLTVRSRGAIALNRARGARARTRTVLDVTYAPHRGASLIAHEIGRLEVAERYRLGWGSSAERAWESAVQRSLEEASRLERFVGPSVRGVWRRAVRAAVVRTWLRSLLGLSLMLLPLTRVGAPLPAVGGVLLVMPLLRAFRRPKLYLGARLEIPSLTDLAAEFGLKSAVQRHPGALQAAALADARFAKMLEAPLSRLDPELCELMVQLQPGFPGSLSELEGCALALLPHPPAPSFSPRRGR